MGWSIVGNDEIATERCGGSVVNLGGLPGFTSSWCQQHQQRRAGRRVQQWVPFPEPRSTWAMMLLGFAGCKFVGYRPTRRAKPQAALEIARPVLTLLQQTHASGGGSSMPYRQSSSFEHTHAR